jgi:hypothetical protein
MAVVYEEGSATDFNERQFVFEFGYVLGRRLRARDSKVRHPWIAYEYHYPDKRGNFARSECDIVVWERRPQKKPRENSQWIEIKSTGFKFGSWNNNFGGLDRARQADFYKLETLETKPWHVRAARAWIWLYQTTNYSAEFNAISKGKKHRGWSAPMDLNQVSEKLGKANKRNMNLPKMLRTISGVAQSSTMRFRTDLKTAPPGRTPLSVFVAVCSVAPRRGSSALR